MTDQAPRRMPFLVVSTLLCVAFTVTMGHGGLMASLLMYVVANIAYQAGQQYYDALLPEVSTEANRGWIGGVGVGVGYLGSFIGIVIGLAFLGGVDALTQDAQTGRYQVVFALSGALFLAFSLPCFLWVTERPRRGRRFTLAAVAESWRQVADTLRHVRRYPGLARFLIGRVFYTDAVNTVIFFMGIYVTNEVGFSTADVQLLIMAALVFAVPGGFLWGRVVDRIGPKRTLDIVLGLWMVIFVWIAVVGYCHLPQLAFWPVPCLTGLALGGTWSADRPYMLRLTPPARIGEFYGLYGMVGRFSAIIGPLVWSIVVDRLHWGRPAAILTLLAGTIIGYVILRPVSDAPRTWKGADLA
jgi:UMF1 family MFS transporter